MKNHEKKADDVRANAQNQENIGEELRELESELGDGGDPGDESDSDDADVPGDTADEDLGI